MAVLTLRPNAAGFSGQSRSTGNNNYECIDEETLNEADYTFVDGGSQSQALYDNYGFPDHSTESDTINSVTVKAYAKKVVTGTNTHNVTIRPLISIGGTKYYGSAGNLTTSTALYSGTWTVNPATGAAWTWANIDNLVAGHELTSDRIDKDNYVDSRCFQLWVEVDYGASALSIHQSECIGALGHLH